MKVNIREQLPKYLGDVKLLTTKCCIMECEKLGPELFGATVILKQFGIHKCGHDETPKPAFKCLKSMVGDKNTNRYFIATQDADLRTKCRKIPGTPVMYLHHSAPILEKPSEMSETFVHDVIDERMKVTSEQKRIENLKRQAGIIEEIKPKKKRKVGNPNPLSCLKKKPKKDPLKNVQNKMESEGKKKKRIRKRKNKAKSDA